MSFKKKKNVAFALLSFQKKAVSIFQLLENVFLKVRPQVSISRLRSLGDYLVDPLYFIDKLRPGGDTQPKSQSWGGAELGVTPRFPNF